MPRSVQFGTPGAKSVLSMAFLRVVDCVLARPSSISATTDTRVRRGRIRRPPHRPFVPPPRTRGGPPAGVASTRAAGRRVGPGRVGSDQAELADRVALLGELGDRGVDPGAREVVDLQALDDRPLAVLGRSPGTTEIRPSGDAVGAVGRDAPSRPSRPRACRAPSRGRGRSPRSRPTRPTTRRGPR